MKKVYIIIDKTMHSYEAIAGIYDTRKEAMESPVWDHFGETPSADGYGENLFIYETNMNESFYG